MEKHVPVIYYYDLVQLSSNLTAKGVQGAVEAAFAKDGLTTYFKQNLWAFASDGARYKHLKTEKLKGLVT